MGVGLVSSSGWFSDGVVRKLGNVASTRFWNEVWVGEAPLKVVFWRLFEISTQKDYSIQEVKGLGVGAEWGHS